MNRRDVLKLVALISMMIDHSYVFFGNQLWIRSLGRLAFPLYCYLIYDGWLRTSDRDKYAGRLGLSSILSQYQFSELFRTTGYNVCVTLLFGLIGLSSPPVALILALVAEKLNSDYGAVGVFTVAIMRFNWVMGIILISAYQMKYHAVYGLAAICSLPLILWYRRDIGEPGSSNKWVRRLWYIGYPGHLLIYYLIKKFIL